MHHLSFHQLNLYQLNGFNEEEEKRELMGTRGDVSLKFRVKIERVEFSSAGVLLHIAPVSATWLFLCLFVWGFL